MGIGYELVNRSQQEVISFCHLPVCTKNEIVSNSVSAAIVSFYLAENLGDDIRFVTDTLDDWPFSEGGKKDLVEYRDVTEGVISKLIELGIIIDKGFEYVDEDEPDTVFIRALVHRDVVSGK